MRALQGPTRRLLDRPDSSYVIVLQTAARTSWIFSWFW